MKRRGLNELFVIDKQTLSGFIQHQTIKKALERFFLVLFGSIFVFSLLVSVYIVILSINLPDVKSLPANVEESTKIYDINNKLVANVHGDEDRDNVPLAKISPWVRSAVIAIEDNRFYEHSGIDLKGTLRAFTSNMAGDSELQGGSTLTQQLVKNSFLSRKRSFNRKLIEAILSIKTEKAFTKNKILEMYLNRVYWGNQCYGIQKASKRYFNKNAGDLNLAESSMLAGIIKAPEGYSPYHRYNLAKIRQRMVLMKMEEYGYITHGQRVKAEVAPLKLSDKKPKFAKYSYFIQYVLSELRRTEGSAFVRRGGLKIYTTLNPRVQEIAEKTITEGIAELPQGSGAKQGALVSINARNGYVQAIVGGVDFKASNFDRATQSKRPPGSSFKPVVYLTGLSKKVITPESYIMDSPIHFNTGWNVWRPHNWDGKYMGRLTIRQALFLSRNTPTVRIALKVGLDSVINTARVLGIRSKIDKNYAIVLGSFGISPLELASVYTVFAREGIYIEPIVIRKIENSQGQTLESYVSNPIRVADEKYVKQLNSILTDVVQKGTGKKAKLDDRVVAGKTGTSDRVRDIWFTGFTPDTVTTIWLGNDANQPLHGVFSSNCAQLWKNFSEQYYSLKALPSQNFQLIEQIDKEKLAKEQKIDGEKKKKEQQIAKKTSIKKKKIKKLSHKKHEYKKADSAAPVPIQETAQEAPLPELPKQNSDDEYWSKANQNLGGE